MENQRPAKNREEGGSMDRISQLPQPILHHILSFLSQIAAGRTCLLSKSWRHLGPTRPKIEFHQGSFPGNREKLLSVLDNTLQRYIDQKLPIQEFVLWMWGDDPDPISFLEKWIPKVIINLGVKKFNLTASNFALSSVVFEAEFLKELYLEGFKLNQINVIMSKRLQKLFLTRVYIEVETLEKIMSSCPLIDYLVLRSCLGLTTIRVNKARNLKHFTCFVDNGDGYDSSSIEIDDVPTLETIRVENCRNWCHDNIYFPRLKSLYLWDVRLSKESFDSFSSNFPCLEELELDYCSGFREFKLSSRSLKRLIIKMRFDSTPIMANVDAPNILYFEFSSNYLPSISFATASSGVWRSCIYALCSWDSNYDIPSKWFLKLNELLKALSRSQIALHVSYHPWTNQVTYDGGGSDELVLVEHLCLRKHYSASLLPVLLRCLFRTCRPRYLGVSLCASTQALQKSDENQLAELIWNTLIKEGETGLGDFWKWGLEESSIEVSGENANEWRPVQVCALSGNEKIRFRLKWRDLI